ncbi:hypothetical protein BGY98DRAFT_940352 [Russula aff. rugulosa BPL654]|nr:hypothetical protein BGY98DRAFT_940352 [Russula aff. rugulosa BPL654]
MKEKRQLRPCLETRLERLRQVRLRRPIWSSHPPCVFRGEVPFACPRAKPARPVSENWRSLHLDVQPDSVLTVEDALMRVFQSQSTHDGPSVLRDARQQMLISALPPVLVLHLNRLIKIGKSIWFGPDLEIPPGMIFSFLAVADAEYFMIWSFQTLWYPMLNLGNGHYTINILHPNGDGDTGEDWLHIDDEVVTRVRHEAVFGEDGTERAAEERYIMNCVYSSSLERLLFIIVVYYLPRSATMVPSSVRCTSRHTSELSRSRNKSGKLRYVSWLSWPNLRTMHDELRLRSRRFLFIIVAYYLPRGATIAPIVLHRLSSLLPSLFRKLSHRHAATHWSTKFQQTDKFSFQISLAVVSSRQGRERENEREKRLSEIGRRGRDLPRSRGRRFHRAITEGGESTPLRGPCNIRATRRLVQFLYGEGDLGGAG